MPLAMFCVPVGAWRRARTAWQLSMELGSVGSSFHLFVDYMLANENDKAIVAHDRAMLLSDEGPAGIADRIRAAADPAAGQQELSELLEAAPGHRYLG